jgi:hypothetical protein
MKRVAATASPPCAWISLIVSSARGRRHALEEQAEEVAAER